MKENAETLITGQDLSLFEKETLNQIAVKKSIDSSKKTRKSSKKSSKKSKNKSNVQDVVLPEPVLNEPESETTRKELTQSRELQLVTTSSPAPVSSPKRTKLPRLKKKSSAITTVTPEPVVDREEPAQESKLIPIIDEKPLVVAAKTESKVVPKKRNARKKTTASRSLPEEKLISVDKKKRKSRKRKQKTEINQSACVEKTKRKTTKKRKTKKRKTQTDMEGSDDEDSYYSDQFLFEMDDGDNFTCLTEADIVAEQSREIQEVGEILSVSHSVAITLLKHFKWNRDKLMTSYFDSPEKVLEAAGVGEESIAVERPKIQSLVECEVADEEVECTICSMDVKQSEMYSLQICGHSFCLDCWEMYLTIQIKEGQAFVNCAHMDCSALVPESEVKNLVASEVYHKYCTYFMQSFVDNNDNVKWCPAPGCGNAVTSDMVRGTTVTCDCSYRFCFQCSEEAHQPASCKQVKLWKKKCQDESETNNWIIANTQECPKCGLPTEKNGGCNHMTCRQCKHEYCWVCYKDWKGHNDFYSCNRYQKSKDDKKGKKNSRKEREQQRLEMRKALEKYLHYHSRFANHTRSSELEATSDKAIKKMRDMQATEATAAEVLFIEQATTQLLIARSVLKYSYVLRYYMDDEDNKAALLEYLQEDLEKTAEDLSESLGNPIKNKLHIVNITALIETRVHNMIDAVDRS